MVQSRRWIEIRVCITVFVFFLDLGESHEQLLSEI